MARDISGLGAVLCIREIYLTIKTALNNCEDLNYPKARKGLATALQKIDEFVLENSITPISKEDMEADYERGNTIFRDQFSNNQPRICRAKLGEEGFRVCLTILTGFNQYEFCS